LPSLQKEDHGNKAKRMKTIKEDSDESSMKIVSKSSQGTSSVDKKWHKDLHTVFVSNLPKTTSQEDFQSIFSSIEGFVEARLVKDREGVPKGFGYVEFQNDQGVKEALKADQSILLGQKIIVRRSKPPKLQRYSTPSRKIRIGADVRRNEMETTQEAKENVDGFEGSSSQAAATTMQTSWTQDDFRKWIRNSSA